MEKTVRLKISDGMSLSWFTQELKVSKNVLEYFHFHTYIVNNECIHVKEKKEKVISEFYLYFWYLSTIDIRHIWIGSMTSGYFIQHW